MLDVLEPLYAALKGGEDAMLTLVLETSGSVPRGMGAKLALLPDGRTAGTVGGGALEQIAVKRGAELLAGRTSGRAYYTLSGGEVSNTGMICGGAAMVGFAHLNPADAGGIEALGKVLDLCREGLPGWLTLEIPREGDARIGVAVKEGEAWRDLLTGRPACRVEEEAAYFAEPVSSGRCFVFGGGHVGRALVPVLAATGFRPTVVDDRPQVALPDFFPQAERVLVGDFDHILSQVAIQSRDYVVIMTHGHRSDLSLLAQILKTPACFIGCLGSGKKAAAVRERLGEMGFSAEDVGRVRSPVGLPIGGETPAEIAVSIAAQMIQIRTELAGGRRHGTV